MESLQDPTPPPPVINNEWLGLGLGLGLVNANVICVIFGRDFQHSRLWYEMICFSLKSFAVEKNRVLTYNGTKLSQG